MSPAGATLDAVNGFAFEVAGRSVDFDGSTTYVMAVINLSPESRIRHSFAADGQAALELARRYVEAGASFIDLGAQSSHFENRELTVDEENTRLLPAVELLVAHGFFVSVDTWKPEVARRALESGAAMVNDTSGLSNPSMVEVVAEFDVPAILTYVEADHPLAVGDLEFVDDKASQVAARFAPRIDELHTAGVSKLILDPGLSINYRSDYAAYTRQQLRVIRNLQEIRAMGHPVMIPVPRKAEMARVMAYTTLSLEYGADVLRVHDVAETCDLVRLFDREPS